MRQMQHYGSKAATWLTDFSEKYFHAVIMLYFCCHAWMCKPSIPLCAAAVMTCLILWRRWRGIQLRDIPLPVWFIIAFFIWVSITPGAWFRDLTMAQRMIRAFLMGLGCIVLTDSQDSRFRLIFGGTLMGMGLFLIPGLAQYAPWETIWKGGRLYLGRHPNILGFVSSFAMITILVKYRVLSGRHPILTNAMLLFNGTALVCSGSRSAVVAMAVVCIAFIIRQFQPRKIIIMLTALAVLLAGAYAMLPQWQQQRLTAAVVTPWNGHDIRMRRAIWHIAVHMIHESPFLGHSQRNYIANYDKTAKLLEKEARAISPDFEMRQEHAHSVYMHTVYCWGLIGGVLVALFCIPAMITAWRRKDDWCFYCFLFYAGFGCLEISIAEGHILTFVPMGWMYGKIITERIEARRLHAAPVQS